MADQLTAGGAILVLNGAFDLTQRDRLKRAFDAIDHERCVVLDLAKTAFIDSTVLGSLLRLRADVLRNGGSFVLVAPSAMLRRLLDITMLSQVFDVRDDSSTVAGIEAFRQIELTSDGTA
jgi:anti-anti-sigma factor